MANKLYGILFTVPPLAYIVRNKKDAQLHANKLNSHKADNGQLCFARALSQQKVVRQQVLGEMLHVAFEDLFPSPVQKSRMLGGGTEKALVDQKARMRYLSGTVAHTARANDVTRGGRARGFSRDDVMAPILKV